MTTVIDHAIAIPTKQNNVWELIRDIAQNPDWQLDCQRVQFLSTSKTGRGTRWRNTTAKGKEQVIEVLAWYEGLGYEYRIVDGANFPNTRGRIRLQEAPEGTIVQWTFSYEVKGFMGSLRNNLSTKGQVDAEIIQGLRNLYTAVKESKSDERFVPEESKSYLREAPAVEERAQYQPRHPSKVQEIVPVEDTDARFKPTRRSTGSMPAIIEPPIAADDTKPNAATQPDVLAITPEAPKAQPRPSMAEPDFLRLMPEQMPQSNFSPASTPSPKLEEETAPAPPPLAIDTELLQPTTPMPQAKIEPLSPNRDISKVDTAQISVFELFGLPKPSETEKVRAIDDAPIAAPPVPNPQPAPVNLAPSLETVAVNPAPSLDIPAEELVPPAESSESVRVAAIFADQTPIIPDVEPESKRRRGLRASLRQRLAPVRLPKID
jgi:hypothetical protein